LRILFINLYYKPEPGGHFYSNIAENWVREGHEVEILSCRPYVSDLGFKENKHFTLLEGVKVHRLPVDILSQKKIIFKALNLIKFCIYALFWSLRKPKFDVILTSSLTPLFMAIICRIICALKGSKFIYRIMDVHPEVWKYSGSFKNKVILKLLEKIEKENCKSADIIVTLSEDMAQTISNRDEDTNLSISIIRDGLPNKISQGTINQIDEIKKKDRFRIVYTGNIGRFQKLETIIDAFHQIPADTPVELLIVGKGLKEDSIKARADKLVGNSIKFIEFQNSITLNEIVKTADIGLVSLLNGVEKCAFPSKVFSYLEQECPVLAVMDDCFLTKFIEENGLGYSLPQDDVDSLARKLIELSRSSHLRKSKQQNIKEIVQIYNNETILEQWSELLTGLE
tara:strand:- start:6297 stop:7487 length:1191 start_codon:yes stop_codon:yes gene_type:complete